MVSFYKHDIAKWMDGTESLDDGPYRAYHVICQLIYLHEGPVELHERGLAGRCNQSVRGFRKHLNALVEANKLTIVDGKISNSRALLELESVKTNRENARKGGERSTKTQNRPAKPLKNNTPTEAPLNQSASLKEKIREEKTRNTKPPPTSTTDTEPQPLPRDQLVWGTDHFDLVHKQLTEASGEAFNAASYGSQDLSAVLSWLDHGCSLALDVLPAIRMKSQKLKAHSVFSWAFFTDTVMAHHQRRTKKYDDYEPREQLVAFDKTVTLEDLAGES